MTRKLSCTLRVPKSTLQSEEFWVLLAILHFLLVFIWRFFHMVVFFNNVCPVRSAISVWCFTCQVICLVLLQVQKCFGLVHIFCARPKIYLHIVTVTNILCQTKKWFAFSKIVFCAGTKVFEEALSAVKFVGWLKKFGPAQNILQPVKGQGIRPNNNR